jgi:large subunit ribosomal protein L13
MPCVDFVIVINADKIAVTGNRLDQKVYYRHSQYPGGLKQTTLRQTLQGKFAERALIHAVRGMVMHNRLGTRLMKRLKVYTSKQYPQYPHHPHEAQKPVPWKGPEALLKQPDETKE